MIYDFDDRRYDTDRLEVLRIHRSYRGDVYESLNYSRDEFFKHLVNDAIENGKETLRYGIKSLLKIKD